MPSPAVRTVYLYAYDAANLVLLPRRRRSPHVCRPPPLAMNGATLRNAALVAPLPSDVGTARIRLPPSAFAAL
ncbi:hypothetical protein BU14_2263s0002, partial [Porphyra umbilicalis]